MTGIIAQQIRETPGAAQRAPGPALPGEFVLRDGTPALIWPLLPTDADTLRGRAAGGGSIINIASIGGHRVTPGRLVYGPSKAALIYLTRQLAAELGPYGIRANSISPGQTPTALRTFSDPAGGDNVPSAGPPGPADQDRPHPAGPPRDARRLRRGDPVPDFRPVSVRDGHRPAGRRRGRHSALNWRLAPCDVSQNSVPDDRRTSTGDGRAETPLCRIWAALRSRGRRVIIAAAEYRLTCRNTQKRAPNRAVQVR